MLKTASRSSSRTQSRWHKPSNSHFFPFSWLLKFCLLDSCPSRIDFWIFWIQDSWTKQAEWRPRNSHLLYKYSLGGIYSRWPKAKRDYNTMYHFSQCIIQKVFVFDHPVTRVHMFEHRCCSKDVEPSTSHLFKKWRNMIQTVRALFQENSGCHFEPQNLSKTGLYYMFIM